MPNVTVLATFGFLPVGDVSATEGNAAALRGPSHGVENEFYAISVARWFDNHAAAISITHGNDTRKATT